MKIGILGDMSNLYADIGGAGSVVAAQMAIDVFGIAKNGMKAEVVSGGHQNKPDVRSGIARQRYDVDHVDAIADVPTSGVALAVSQVIIIRRRLGLRRRCQRSGLNL